MTLFHFACAALVAATASACLDDHAGSADTSVAAADANLQNPEAAPDTTAPEPEADTSTPTPEADTTAPEPEADTTAPAPDASACLALDADCREDASCCSGICSYTGVYTVTSTCIGPQPLGSFCSADHWCDSGYCVNGVCAQGACFEKDVECTWEATRCCAPQFCSWDGSYAPGYCTSPLPAGGFCRDASWCQSGACTADGVCL